MTNGSRAATPIKNHFTIIMPVSEQDMPCGKGRSLVGEL